MSDLTDFRAELDEFMAYHPQSPLDDDQQEAFAGLDYYPENEQLRMLVDVARFGDDEPLIEMQTSTGDMRPYRRWGRFAFTIGDQEAALTIYSDPYHGDFFLPFRDITNGEETYGAGRYLDNHRPGLQQVGELRFEVDFNYAYNPYCAYSPAYSCPLPPRENWVKVPIRAGEKDYVFGAPSDAHP
jgi:uncharacterized protein (DUF1684 family)